MNFLDRTSVPFQKIPTLKNLFIFSMGSIFDPDNLEGPHVLLQIKGPLLFYRKIERKLFKKGSIYAFKKVNNQNSFIIYFSFHFKLS